MITDPNNPSKQKKLLHFDDFWMPSPYRRRVTRIEMQPDRKPGFDPETGVWNLWQGWAYTPREPDESHSWTLLKRHVLRVIANGNKSHADYIFNWLAFCIQFPAKLPEVALVLRGEQGAGKGTLIKAMLKLFGRHGLAVHTKDELLGKHNSHLRDSLFVFADEAFFAGDKSALGALNALITEETKIIEPKFVDAMKMRNYRKIAMASNESWVVPAGLDARRYAIFDVSSKHVGDWDSYFGPIVDQLEHGGYEAMLWDLQHRDLSQFQVRDFPKTAALFQQKKSSWDETTDWYFEKLCDESEWPRNENDEYLPYGINREVVAADVADRTKNPYELRNIRTRIGITLRKLCPKLQDRRPRDEKNVGRTRMYIFPNLIESRKAFEKALKLKKGAINWETGEQKDENQ